MNKYSINQIEKDVKTYREMAEKIERIAGEYTRIADCLEELIVYRNALQVANKECANG